MKLVATTWVNVQAACRKLTDFGTRASVGLDSQIDPAAPRRPAGRERAGIRPCLRGSLTAGPEGVRGSSHRCCPVRSWDLIRGPQTLKLRCRLRPRCLLLHPSSAAIGLSFSPAVGLVRSDAGRRCRALQRKRSRWPPDLKGNASPSLQAQSRNAFFRSGAEHSPD
jgi:hypothetical protein